MRKILMMLAMLLIASEAYSFESSYDVIIAGGGTGGTAAAIQASRLGVSVLIVEPTNMLGGQATTAGVSTMDDMSNIESGIYHEFMNRIRKHYGSMRKSISTCYWKDYGKAFEPSVGHKILADMAASADVMYYSEIVSVNDESVSIRTPEGIVNVNYKILIDATEYGDILPLAGVTYRIGNSISPNINDTMIQDITWTAVIRKYPKGIPEHLRVKTPLEGYDKALKNYRDYVARNGFDFKGRYPVRMPVNVATHNAYRAIPDSYSPGSYTGAKKDWKRITKCGVNWGNDYPGMYLWHGRYGIPVNYIESRDMRAEIEREALIKTLHYIYYMQNELKESWSVDENEYSNDILPEAARDLPDEWKAIMRHMPPIPYVRESRRILGEYTLNAHDTHINSMSWHNGEKSHEFTDAIAIGGYNIDLHGGDDDDDIESSLGEAQSSIERDKPLGAFQVPLRVLIPMSKDNILAAEKNLSMSRLVSGALRLQPITMMTGQAAGALAAISIQKGIKPREVKAIHVQKVLGDAGVAMSLCRYTDVSSINKYYGAIQISNLYGLIDAEVYPAFSKGSVNNPGKGGRTKGRFGVNKIVSEKEFARIIERAEKFTDGRKITLPEHKKLTKGEAAELIVNAICE